MENSLIHIFYATNDKTVERGGYTYAFDRHYSNNTATYRCRRKVNSDECKASIRVIQSMNPKKPAERMWERNDQIVDNFSKMYVFGKVERGQHIHRPYSCRVTRLVDSWSYDIAKMGKLFETRSATFIPMKAPLGVKFNSLVEAQHRFNPKDINTHDELYGLTVGMLINLSAHNTYDTEELPADCEYVRIASPCDDSPPTKEDFAKFRTCVEKYTKEGRYKPIGVHCMQGYNRTGFMICAYLIETQGYDVSYAVKEFAKARPDGIYNEEFVNELRARYPQNDQGGEVNLVRPSCEPLVAFDRRKITARKTMLVQDYMTVPSTEVLKKEILEMCQQKGLMSWKQFVENRTFVKIGEGTFGEIYMDQNGIVIKVIPFIADGTAPKVNREPMRRIAEVHAELFVTQSLSALDNDQDRSGTPCFMKFKKSYVVKGVYPKALLDPWVDYKKDKSNKSQNQKPSTYSSNDRTFLILEVAHAGIDLERYLIVAMDPNNSLQLISIFFQVAISLAIAEDILEMEHRDLHESNILVRPLEKHEPDTIIMKLSGVSYHLKACRVKVTIIDFSLSRIRKGDRLFYLDLAKEDLFNGPENDPQSDAYRAMRTQMGDRDWTQFEPFTNNVWLRFLATKLMEKEPPSGSNIGINDGNSFAREINNLNYLREEVTKYPTIREFLANQRVNAILTTIRKDL